MIIRAIIILLFGCANFAFSQSFPAENHPPQYLETNVDIGPIIMRKGNKAPHWNSYKDRWEFYIDVFNAYNMKFELGVNKYTFPNGFDIDKSLPYKVIPKYSALSLNQLWDEEDGITTWHKGIKLEIYPDRRESIIFRAKKMNLLQWVEPYLDIILSETFQEIIDEYFPGKSLSTSDSKKLKETIVKGLKLYMIANNWNGKPTEQNIKKLFLDFVGTVYSSKLKDILESKDALDIIKKLDPMANVSWDSILKKIVNKAVAYVKGPKFWKLIGKKGGEKLVEKGTLAIDAFNVMLHSVDYQTYKDLNIASRIYFKDSAPKITQSAYNDGKITWKYYDAENDVVMIDIYYRKKNQGSYAKFNQSPINASKKVHFLNQTLSNGTYEYYFELSYPSGYPLRISDIYDRPGIINPLINGKVRSGTYSLIIGSDQSNSQIKTGMYSVLSNAFNFQVEYLNLKKAKPGEIPLKDYFSKKAGSKPGFKNIGQKRTFGFDFYWGAMPYKKLGEDSFKKAFFLGHLIEKNSNILIGALFVPEPRSVTWIFLEPKGNEMKVFFTKDLNKRTFFSRLKK